jgi:hypothetical protein
MCFNESSKYNPVCPDVSGGETVGVDYLVAIYPVINADALGRSASVFKFTIELDLEISGGEEFSAFH